MPPIATERQRHNRPPPKSGQLHHPVFQFPPRPSGTIGSQGQVKRFFTDTEHLLEGTAPPREEEPRIAS